ncbi:MAG TPA: hypothetical protein VFF04_06825, partial [Candidatus Babeliales bacterium]|nr:hypothetical protein [Candidatus Babeliales bacterium]
QRGGLGDVKVKKYLIEVLNTLLEPMRVRRAEFAKDKSYINAVLKEGTEKTLAVAQQTMTMVKKATSLNYW